MFDCKTNLKFIKPNINIHYDLHSKYNVWMQNKPKSSKYSKYKQNINVHYGLGISTVAVWIV